MRHLLACLASLCALHAQSTTQSAFAFVPKDAIVVLRCSGPAKWRERFAGTQLANLAPAFAAVVVAVDTALEHPLAEVPKEFDLAGLERAATAYSGEIVLAFAIDRSSLVGPRAFKGTPKMSVLLSFGPDGHTDLKSVAGKLGDLAGAAGGELAIQDVAIGDRTLRAAGLGSFRISLPIVQNGSMLMLASNDFESSAKELLARREHYVSTDEQAASSLSLHVELEALVQAWLTTATSDNFNAEMATRLGLRSIVNLNAYLGAAGKRAQSEWNVRFNDQERGAFNTYAARKAAESKILPLLPPTATTFDLMPFDLRQLFRAVGNALDALGPSAHFNRTALENQFTEFCKIRLREDLIDHLGSELLRIDDESATTAALPDVDDNDRERAHAASQMWKIQGSCYCMLAEGKALGQALEKLIRARGLHVQRKTVEYHGTKIHRLNLLNLVDFEYATNDDLVLIAFGPGDGAGKHLRAVLDRHATGALAKGTVELPAVLKDRLGELPANWSAVGLLSIGKLITGAMASLEQSFGDNPGFDKVNTAVAALCAEMKRLGVDSMAGAGYVEPKAIRYLTRW